MYKIVLYCTNMTQTLNSSDVRANWSQLLNKVFRGETEVLVEKSGIPIAAIVSTQDYQKLQQLKEKKKKDFALVNEIRAAFAHQSVEQIKKGVEVSIEKVRKQR